MIKKLKFAGIFSLVFILGAVNVSAASNSNSYMSVSATIAPSRNFGTATVAVDPAFYGTAIGGIRYTAGFQVWENKEYSSASGKGGYYTYINKPQYYSIVSVMATGRSNQNGVVRTLSTAWQK